MTTSKQQLTKELGFPKNERDLTDEQLEALWKRLGDVPLNYAEDGSTLVPIEGFPESAYDECIDEDFYLWPRGTFKWTIWYWFDACHSLGLVKMQEKMREKTYRNSLIER